MVLAARQSTLVVFEDVHWIDPTSLDFLALALLAWAVPLTRRGAPHLFALLAICLSLVAGASVYATDRLATQWDARTFSADPPDWLDRSGLGPARYLTLPRSNDFLGKGILAGKFLDDAD